MAQNTKPELVIECLGIVLSFLQLNQVPTLISLLRVNKTFFQLTVPYLYQSPFIIVQNQRAVADREKIDRLVFLLGLFLAELDPKLRAELPPCSDEDEDDEGKENRIIAQGVTSSYAAQIGGYFYYYRKHDHSFLVDYAIPQLFGTLTELENQSIIAQLDSAFLHHCGNRVLSLCLPSTRVQQFRSFIPILERLKRLEIYQIREITESSLEELVEWIKEHDAVHGTLGELQIGGSAESEQEGNNNAVDLIQLPLAFKSLRVLDTRVWRQAWSKIDQLQVESLVRLVMDYGESEPPGEGSDFLLRCQSMEVLDLFIPAPDTFQGLLRLFKARHYPFLLDSQETIPQGVIPSIERLYISGPPQNLRNALEQAPIALCQTLRVLKASSRDRHEEHILEPSLTWGRPLIEIQMPFLQEIQLQGDIGLEFHFGLLRCCPNLTTLKIIVNGMDSCDQPGNPLEEILSLKRLQILQLFGRWYLKPLFLEGIATQLTSLKMLDLARCYGVTLDQVMEAVHSMEFLWRVGWDLEDVPDPEAALAKWTARAPKIRVGLIRWTEFMI
ncbi:MAG: hypothetical protein J3Q66DRAFT_357228 [Benniella sp.]|nr:MAG: hypothetical protein J3Q66DRAFT_357228 [Benniella sp.]